MLIPEVVPALELYGCPLVMFAGTEMLWTRWQLAPAGRYCDGAGGQSLVMVSGEPAVAEVEE